jgi:hypothetical protein
MFHKKIPVTQKTEDKSFISEGTSPELKCRAARGREIVPSGWVFEPLVYGLAKNDFFRSLLNAQPLRPQRHRLNGRIEF